MWVDLGQRGGAGARARLTHAWLCLCMTWQYTIFCNNSVFVVMLCIDLESSSANLSPTDVTSLPTLELHLDSGLIEVDNPPPTSESPTLSLDTTEHQGRVLRSCLKNFKMLKV